MLRTFAVVALCLIAPGVLAAPCQTGCSGISALQCAANGLGARQWCKFNSSLSREMLEGCGGPSLLNINTYAHNMAWDSLNRQAHFEGNRHNGASRRIVYSEATNSWSSWVANGINPASCSLALCTYVAGDVSDPERNGCSEAHGYDHNTADGSGWVYYRKAGITQTTLRIWDGATWTSSIACGSTCNNDAISGGIEWFPARNAVMYLASNGTIAEWRKATQTWAQVATGLDFGNVAAGPSQGYGLDYNPFHGVMWAFEGNGSINYRVSAAGVATLLPAAPMDLGSDITCSAVDPNTGFHIVYHEPSGVWRQFDVMTGAWTTFTSLGITMFGLDLRPGNTFRDTISVTIPDRNVSMWVAHSDGDSVTSTYLYRHSVSAPPALLATVTVKESTNVAATDHPIVAMIPVAEGALQDTTSLRVWDVTAGANVPAQFSVASRRAARDNSVRYVQAQFEADVAALGTRVYEVGSDSGGPSPSQPVSVADNTPSGYVQVTTGPIRFTVSKTASHILDTVWYDLDADGLYESGATEERILQPSTANGPRVFACDAPTSGNCASLEAQHGSTLVPDLITIEEFGPMRAVIRLERFTRYTSIDALTHGYVARLYAYAGKPWIKVDYQLVNAATDDNGNILKTGKFSDPFYFDSVDLDFSLNLTGTVTVKTSLTAGAVDSRTLDTNGVEFATTDSDSSGSVLTHREFELRHANNGVTNYTTCVDAEASDTDNDCATAGFMDVSNGTWGVQAIYRNYWQLFPSGLETSTGPKLTVELWPDWGSQWYHNGTSLQSTSVYWLGDMRASYKEILLNFHAATPSDATLNATANLFQRHPVPSLPLSHYRTTRTLPLREVPTTIAATPQDAPPTYAVGALDIYKSGDMDETGLSYGIGWERWYPGDGTDRYRNPCSPGNGPASAEWFIATGSTRHYWNAERAMLQEINGRPEWMGRDYTHADDWNAVRLGDNSPGSPCLSTITWRENGSNQQTFPIAPAAMTISARDPSHTWDYHVQDAYWLTGNLWALDWSKFTGEYMQYRLAGNSGADWWRARGHTTKSAIWSYHTTGQASLLQGSADYFWNEFRGANDWCGQETGFSNGSLQRGFAARTTALLLDELKTYDWPRWAKMFVSLSAFLEADYNRSRFNGTTADLTGNDRCGLGVTSAATAWPVVDSIAWYYWNTGLARFKTRNESYFTTGITNTGDCFAAGDPHACCSGPGAGTCNGDTPYCSNNLDPDLFPCYAPGGQGTDHSFADAASHWNGLWSGRMFYWVNEQTRSDTTPPGAPTNVQVSGTPTATVTWSAPSGSPSYYLAVVCDKPISEAYLSSSAATASQCQWWWGTPNATTSTSVQVAHTYGATVYAGVFAFDAADNMGAMGASGAAPSLAGAQLSGGRIN